ncbi:CAP domain-containing protein [Candidatus Uabimicrobium sp. HlEnr_7]|uniref:CAP domain-containing protein n=1 Tax=Candidatus Uabimicrobium helgolandensis TaxID=3095367 RepID=UPI003557E17A
MHYIFFFVAITFCSCTSFFTPSFYSSSNMYSLAESILAESNKVRKTYKLPVLVTDEKLRKIAENYSKYMAEKDFFSHTDPQNRKLSRRLSLSGVKFLLAAENLALISKGNFVANEVIQAWLESKDHRLNLLDKKFIKTGIGVVANSKGHYYITHIFLQPTSR